MASMQTANQLCMQQGSPERAGGGDRSHLRARDGGGAWDRRFARAHSGGGGRKRGRVTDTLGSGRSADRWGCDNACRAVRYEEEKRKRSRF